MSQTERTHDGERASRRDAPRYRPAGRLGLTRDYLMATPAVVPGLLATVTFLALALSEGGYFSTTRYPWALFVLFLTAIALVALGAPRGLPRASRVALALLVGYVLWTFLSIAWADQPDDAWDGACRNAAYAMVFALFTLWPANAWSGRLLLATFGLGVAAVGLFVLLRAGAATDPGQYFIEVRLASPTGYTNANAALWTLGALACLALGARRETGLLLRGALCGGAVLNVGLALLVQSRGWALVTPLALLALLALTPGRVRLLATIGMVMAGVAAAAGPLLAVHDDFGPGRLPDLLDSAISALLVAVVVVAAIGVAWGAAERRVSLSPDTGRRLGRGVGIAGAVVVAVAAIGFVAVEGSPLTKVSDGWQSFKDGGAGSEPGSSRFTTGSTNRYDFWVVAWKVFEDHPLRGVGADTFQDEYLKRGTSPEKPMFAHSLEMGVLEQTGLVGVLLLGGALIAAFAAAVPALRGPPQAAAVAAAALALVAYWLLHASVDWFWEYPALTAPALAALGIAGALAPRGVSALERRPLPAVALIAGAVATAALAVAFVPSWIAARDVSEASKDWRDDPDAAFERLDRAARMAPLSPRAQLTAGTIALNVEQRNRANRLFGDALARDPGNSYAELELGLLASDRGERARALRYLGAAARDTPRDEIVTGAYRALRSGRPLRLEQVNDEIRRNAQQRGR